jgi:hypothetical protein
MSTANLTKANSITDVLLCEPADEYHAKSRQYLSSHLLADFRRCPLLYYRKRLGLVPDEDRPAYLLGHAAHTLILEGIDAFRRSYAVGGPINPKTGQPFGSATKAWGEWAEAQGKPVLTQAQCDLVMRMAQGVRGNGIAADLLSEGTAEGVVRADYCGMSCQIRMDFLAPHRSLVDLKTCDDLTWFESDARRYGYAHQVAFYRAVLAARTGSQMPVHFIAVEKKEPYRCGVWHVMPDTLHCAQKENEAAIERLKRCVSTDVWPTGYEECRVFDSI